MFWVVGRTSQDEDVNLVLENVTFDMQIKMSLPFPNKRNTRAFSWDSSMMPVVPILVNKKTWRTSSFWSFRQTRRMSMLRHEDFHGLEDQSRASSDVHIFYSMAVAIRG